MHFAQLSTNPLYAVLFFSRENSTVYVYSINGQFLDSVQDKSGFVYGMSVLPATDSTECLVLQRPRRSI